MAQEVNADLFAWILGFAAAVALIITLFGFNWGTTHNGVVDTSGCVATEQLQVGDWGTFWHTFYCSNYLCDATETSFSGKCEVHYYYTQPGYKGPSVGW